MSSYSYCQTTQDDWNRIISDVQREVDILCGVGEVKWIGEDTVIELDSADWHVIVRHVAYAKFHIDNGKPFQTPQMWDYIEHTTTIRHAVKQGIITLKRAT